MSFPNAAKPLRLYVDKLSARAPLSLEEEAAVLALPALPRQIAPNRDIVRLGEQVDHACFVAEGTIARFAQLEDGRRQLVSFHIPGDMADLYSLVLPASPSALMAVSRTTIFQIPHAALRQMSGRFPNLAAALWRDCVIDGNIVAQWLVNIGRRTARGRMAHMLCELALRYESIGKFTSGRFPLPITQEHLADALGLTPVHVNRSLRTLREDGLVQLSRSEATILNWDGLAQVAEFDPGYLYLPEPDGRHRRAHGGAS